MGFKNPVFILLATLIYSTVLHHSESKEMRAFVGSTVTLPCHVNITKCGELHSVKWYRESSRIYVFSQNGEIKRAEGDAIERMEVVYQPTSTDALLKISQVRIEDEASYKCEITYLDVRENCDIVQVVKLNTLVVPVETRIHNKGVTLENNTVLPPADEGSELELVCEARRGKPTPMVRWFNGTREMKATYTSQNDSDGLGTGTANLRVLLSRGDLKANYECRVESDALDEPLVRTVYPNVSVRPTNVELTGFKDHVVEGTTVFLTCEVSGARPAARIRWQNDTEPVNNKTEITTTFHEQNDGTFKTKSDLLFTSTRFEDEKAFYCFADNDLMVNQNESPLRVVKHMKVYYPPIVWLGMNNVTVNESNPVLLFCSHYANPMKLNNVVWVKDGENLTLNRDRYEGGTPEFPSLRILNVLRTDMGSYTCICGNSVGSTRSNTSVYLDVLYPPTVTVEMSTTTPVKSVDCTNVTLKCSRISGNPEGFKKVHWYLNDLMLTENSCDVTQHDASETCNTTRKCEIDPSLILLERVQEGFAGNYSCAAMNEAGWSDRSNSTQLVVYYPPKGVTLTYTPREVIKNENVTLRCQVKHFGEPLATTYIWYKGGYEVRDVHEATWTIKPVTLEQRANYSCVAANEGGMSKPANTSIEVYAPPAFISKFNSYQGILVTSENVSLSCRIECHPICSIVWEKDGHPLEVNDNPLYYVKTTVYDADFKKNDFESIESTLIFNISSWPGGQLDKTAPNSNYTCKSIKNKVGPGVEATVEIAVDYPPESLITSTRFVEVDEGRKPDPVQCSAKGRPTVQYAWRKEGSTELLSNKPVLQIDRPLSREDSGTYLCEVRNRHGFNSTPVFFNVFYPPECSITMKDVGGKQNLICSAKANPDNVQFTWIEKNETVEVPETSKEGLKSILVLESNVAYARTFVCYANNSVGRSSGCEIDVPGNNVPWWQRLERETMLIIIASIIAIIICVLIVCIIIIILCRRKRANNKYSNQMELEERENPDNTETPRWPVFAQKIHTLPMSITASHFKTKAVSKTSRFFKCKRNKGKAYARLERLKDLLVGTGTHNRVPIGITQGPAGVVTFKRVEPTTPSGPPLQLTTSRKRKRPGDVPNSAATGNKNNLGVAPTDGAQMNANPNGNPEDKGFYENLPFHGMQNPPNKPVSVIAPFVQACNQPFNLSYNTNTIYKANAIKRHQSFHGFGNNDVSQQFYPMNVPSILYHLPQSFNYPTGSSTVGSLSTRQQQQFNRVQSFANLDQFNCYPPQMCNQFFVRNPFNGFLQNGLPRVVGRREIYKPTLKLNTSENKFYKPLDIRTTASGLNYDENKVKDEKLELPKVNQDEEEKRFGSLEIKKHKCYSPTFYSMRCKKHAKKRPVIYALPKKVLKVKEEGKNKSFEKLTDSIEISEQNSKDDGKTLPKPTPRCKRPKTELIYENISDVLKEMRDDLNSSNESAENSKPKISVTEALIHDSSKTEEVKVKEKVSPTNNIPTVKISPNFIKPKVESPKGALYMKIHAKRKSSPLVQKVETVQEDQPTTVNVPKMPLLDTATKLGIKSPNKQNAFYTLTTPHYKHAKPGLSQPYSSTIPHQKHMKLLPRALFQDQQLPKSKSFSSKTKQKKHFQIPLQKCHSFKFQTAESYFQPIKNVHEENLMRNGYVSDYVEPRRHKQKTRGPLVVRGSGDFHENLDIQECVRLQYPQPQHCSPGVRPNGVVYADLDMPPGGSGGGKKHHHLDGSASLPKAQKIKPKTEYATLKFNEVGQEIDV